MECGNYFYLSGTAYLMFYDRNLTSAPDFELYTDAASTVGFGGYFRTEWFMSEWSEEIRKMQDQSMAFLELYPIVVAAILWGHLWHGKKILFHCDNQATVEIIKKGRSKCITIAPLMRRLIWCAAKYNFMIYAKHVQGVKNYIADSLSRFKLQEFRKAAPQAQLLPKPCPSFNEVMWN